MKPESAGILSLNYVDGHHWQGKGERWQGKGERWQEFTSILLWQT